MKKYITFIILLITSLFAWAGNYYYPQLNLKNIALSFSIFTVSYLIFKVILENSLFIHITNKKTRYTFKKIISLFYLFVTTILILRIWIPDGSTFIAIYGFIAAAIAFSIQDVFKNFVGGLMIFIKGIYKVGDRVQINDTIGDVIDIDVWYTYILEIEAWVAGDQPTGRIVTLPNSLAISGKISNYTDDHGFIWDEIHVPIAYGTNWNKAEKIFQDILNTHTEKITPKALKDIKKLEEKYFLSVANTESKVFVKLTDNWISLYGRYLTDVRTRRTLNSTIHRALLEEFSKESDITISSMTISVTTHSK
jgi:small-conductance mechanosensitive channel